MFPSKTSREFRPWCPLCASRDVSPRRIGFVRLCMSALRKQGCFWRKKKYCDWKEVRSAQAGMFPPSSAIFFGVLRPLCASRDVSYFSVLRHRMEGSALRKQGCFSDSERYTLPGTVRSAQAGMFLSCIQVCIRFYCPLCASRDVSFPLSVLTTCRQSALRKQGCFLAPPCTRRTSEVRSAQAGMFPDRKLRLSQ